MEPPTYPSRGLQRAYFFLTYNQRRFRSLLKDVITLFSLEAQRGNKIKIIKHGKVFALLFDMDSTAHVVQCYKIGATLRNELVSPTACFVFQTAQPVSQNYKIADSQLEVF